MTKRIAKLTPLQLEAALARLGTLNIGKTAKKQLENMLRSASNPASQAIDVVVAQLERERQTEVAEAARAITKITSGALARASSELYAMSNDEWDDLVERANEES